jgi:LysM repeat protein
VEGASEQHGSRTLTPAVLGAALFLAATAVFAITFVAGRGGLRMPVAPSGQPVAIATQAPTRPPVQPTPEATLAPPASLAPPTATATPTEAPTPPPPTAPPPSIDPNDPLVQLPGCPDHPGCFEYVIERGDTFTGIVSRYLLSVTTVLTLNPEVRDPRVIVVGHTLYLGHDPLARLDPCPNAEPCKLYTVVSGDSVAGIAGRYGLTVDAIRDANPGMHRPLQVGDVLKLPVPTP